MSARVAVDRPAPASTSRRGSPTSPTRSPRCGRWRPTRRTISWRASDHAGLDAAITAYARESLAADRPSRRWPSLCNRITPISPMTRQATVVATRRRAFKLKRGVCQDFSHVMIAGLRGLGVPAGYVSGFLRTIPPPGKERLEGADAMHAWVRAWCGREAGWLEFDPTNGMRAGDDHITVGYGRDYSTSRRSSASSRSPGGQKTEQSVDVVPV